MFAKSFMSQYYRGQRSKNIFNPESQEPFKISRSRLENFLRCPRCFYLDRRLGVDQPPGYPFALNAAVDYLLKKEFDHHRAKGEPHPLMKSYGLKAVPFRHKDLEKWRDNFSGIEYHHPPTNLIISGAIDDLWQNERQELIVVDYKATSKDEEVNLEADWQRGYKNQMEIYQWLFRMNGFSVSPTGYFVYVNGRRDRAAFDAKLEFDVKLIPYAGDTSWVEPALAKLKECLLADVLPPATPECDYCLYRDHAAAAIANQTKRHYPQSGQIDLFAR